MCGVLLRLSGEHSKVVPFVMGVVSLGMWCLTDTIYLVCVGDVLA